MENAYAQALWKMIEKGMAPSKAVHALRETLVGHGREALMPRISRAFARIAEREEHKKGITLTIAREKDERTAKSHARDILEKMGVDAKNLKTQVDDTLIGGWRLEGNGVLVDSSHKKHLLSIFNGAIKA